MSPLHATYCYKACCASTTEIISAIICAFYSCHCGQMQLPSASAVAFPCRLLLCDANYFILLYVVGTKYIPMGLQPCRLYIGLLCWEITMRLHHRPCSFQAKFSSRNFLDRLDRDWSLLQLRLSCWVAYTRKTLRTSKAHIVHEGNILGSNYSNVIRPNAMRKNDL